MSFAQLLTLIFAPANQGNLTGSELPQHIVKMMQKTYSTGLLLPDDQPLLLPDDQPQETSFTRDAVPGYSRFVMYEAKQFNTNATNHLQMNFYISTVYYCGLSEEYWN